MTTLTEKLKLYANNNLNVLLIGTHGIGKSQITKAVAEELGLKFKYYSTSTLDPFADMVGIPAPDKESNTLKFYRPKEIEDAEFLMFDELNRAHPRVLNSILELVQFKTINGVKLPNLKMVWAAINPPGEDYQVEELDPALVDRFHVFVKMKAEINLEYMKTKMSTDVAKLLKDWWENFLDTDQKRILTPRRLEYLGFMISNKIPWRDAIPQGHTFPTDELEHRIKIMNNEEDDFILDKDNILKKKDALLKKVLENPSLAIPISNAMKKFTENDLYECKDLLESLPKELVVNIGQHKFAQRKRIFREMFLKNGLDISKYPRICEAFSFGAKDATK